MTRMGRAGWTAAMAFSLLAGMAIAGTDTAKSPKPSPALDRFKGLAGEWVAAEDGEMVKQGELVASYHLTAGGSAVVEELFPGMHHAMTTVYFMEGDDLVLTHYCMNGNQPHMRAKATAAPRIEFAFDGGSNIDAAHTKHMHSAVIEFVGPDELRSTWTEYEGGKVSMTVVMHRLRKSDATS